jgi:hypothetical protein
MAGFVRVGRDSAEGWMVKRERVGGGIADWSLAIAGDHLEMILHVTETWIGQALRSAH